MTLRVLVLGATGNFGARIIRALKGDPAIELVAASRRGGAVSGAKEVRVVVLDALAANFPARLREIGPGLVIHCAGPFQGQDYRVANAALGAGAHYLDLADGRAFVVQFAPTMDAIARAAGRVAISGASTLPTLPTAAIDVLREPMRAMDTVEIVIAPGQRAVRGPATLAAVFSYLGRPVPVWRNGRWINGFGWMDIRRVPLEIGSRWGALCEVPDLTLIPARYPEVQNVTFHAALEFRLQHLVLWKLAALRRMGFPFPVCRWSVWLDRMAALFEPFAGDWGGMCVSVVGEGANGVRLRRTWQLTVPAANGPEIPCIPVILLTRRIASGQRMEAGAHACLGFVKLAEFAPEFARWGIRTRIEEGAT